MAKMGEKVGDLDFHLRSLGSNARDSSSASDPASDPHIIQSVRKIYEICKEEGSEDLVAAVPEIRLGASQFSYLQWSSLAESLQTLL